MRVLGIIKITANGKLLRVLPGAKMRVGGYKNTSVVGHEYYGPSKEFVPSQVTFSIAKTRDTDLQELQDLEDATFLVEGDDGVAYTLANMNCTSDVEVSDKGGGASYTFEGKPAKKR